jgi:PleD family two-component response regulator
MSKNGSKKILAVLDDLFFTVKIAAAAKQAGLEIEVVKDEKQVFEKAKEHPMLIIVDLNGNSFEPLKLLTKLKSNSETKSVRVIGFVSHVQGELKQKAHETGCDMVLARSAFSQNLPMLLKR